jgi:hypothetical protein
LALDAITDGFKPGEVVQITALDPAGGDGGLVLCGELSVQEDRDRLKDFIRTHNGRRNLYFGINPRRAELRDTTTAGKLADVTARRTFYLDLDLKDAPDADPDWTQTLAELEAFGPEKIVETGNGYHVHFRTEELTGEALAASVGPLADALSRVGSDNVADLPRIARLPWTVNLPKDSKRRHGAVPRLARPRPMQNPPSAPTPLEDLCTAMAGVAEGLGLPGRGSPSTPRNNPPSGEKTGRPAPSVEVLRMAMEEMPNDGPFDDRDEWMHLAHAVKGAAMAGGIEAEGRDIWLEWCAHWDGGGDPAADAAAWDGITNPHTGWGAIMRWLEQHNPKGAKRVHLAVAQHRFADEAASNAAACEASFNAFIPSASNPNDPETIPPIDFLYGKSMPVASTRC